MLQFAQCISERRRIEANAMFHYLSCPQPSAASPGRKPDPCCERADGSVPSRCHLRVTQTATSETSPRSTAAMPTLSPRGPRAEAVRCHLARGGPSPPKSIKQNFDKKRRAVFLGRVCNHSHSGAAPGAPYPVRDPPGHWLLAKEHCKKQQQKKKKAQKQPTASPPDT